MSAEPITEDELARVRDADPWCAACDEYRNVYQSGLLAALDAARDERDAAIQRAEELRHAATDVVLQEGRYFRLGSKTPDRLLAVVPQHALRALDAALRSQESQTGASDG